MNEGEAPSGVLMLLSPGPGSVLVLQAPGLGGRTPLGTCELVKASIIESCLSLDLVWVTGLKSPVSSLVLE